MQSKSPIDIYSIAEDTISVAFEGTYPSFLLLKRTRLNFRARNFILKQRNHQWKLLTRTNYL